MTRKGEKMVYPHNKEVLPGPQTTYASLGARWANVANTPFRFWKAKSYEGGICTPMIAHWPKGIKKNVGGMTPEIGHVMDIMATCIDMAGATYPAKYKGNDIIPMAGKSLLPISKPVIVKDMIIWASSISMSVHSLPKTVGNSCVRARMPNGNSTT